MDAAADYAAAREALGHTTLPAYVSYVVRSHAGFDAIKGDETSTIVVRTADGAVVGGKPPKMKINGDDDFNSNVVRDDVFKPACYAASGATLTTFDGQPVEAIALRAVCREKSSSDHSENTDFTTLYVEPVTHRPLAVVGSNEDQYVKARIDERYLVADGHVLPASFSVKVAGSGPMFWLNVDAGQQYSDYRFLREAPPAESAARPSNSGTP